MSNPIAVSLPRRRGFSLTELLVVIGIIALLTGLLLVALGSVRDRAKQTETEATMRAFGQAAESFQIDHGQYPGMIPESVMVLAPNNITSTENAVISLMGGARVIYRPIDQVGTNTRQAYDDYGAPSDPYIEKLNFGSDWELKINRNLIGEGPYVDGKPLAPYFTVSGSEIVRVKGQYRSPDPNDFSTGAPNELPELVDSWGQPILFMRRLRPVGDLVGTPDQAQFTLIGLDGYLKSTALGEMQMPQASGTTPSGIGVTGMSILDDSAVSDPQRNRIMARLIRHRAFGDTNEPQTGTSRGALIMISAGPDGVFFSQTDGPGTPETPVTGIDIADNISDYPDVVLDEYDDIIITAGG